MYVCVFYDDKSLEMYVGVRVPREKEECWRDFFCQIKIDLCSQTKS